MMNKLFLGLLFAVGVLVGANAMTQSGIPSRFNIPWGNSAGPTYIRNIPQASQIGIVNCAASLTDGFPPLTFTPVGSGGCPPFGQDFNGILKQITQWSQWQAAGGPVFYDATFSTSVGGYPKGAILQSTVLSGRQWFSTADNNTTNPDSTSSANWIALPGTNPAGAVIAMPTTTTPPGMVPANGLTIGNASSNASSRANADAFWLFSFIWNNCSTCTLFNSGGGVIARGANATADWNANDAIATMNMNGSTLMGADSMAGTTTSNLVNVPVTSGSRTAPNSILGENLHTLTVGELATHNHTLTDPGHTHPFVTPNFGTVFSLSYISGSSLASNVGGGGAFGGFDSMQIGTRTTGITIATAGSNTPHNTVARSTITYWYLQL